MRFTSIAAAFLTITLPCLAGEPVKFNDVVSKIADGWRGEIVSEVDQSYPGWDVEIGDADNDGKNEILTTGCPDSRLYLFKKVPGGWITNLLAENMARQRPGMGLAVKVVDLNKDGKNEIIVGTGQEKSGTAHFHVFQTDGQRITRHAEIQPSDCLKSGFTHDLAAYDLNGDGVLEVLSVYCGHGEVIRYTVDKNLINISARKVHQLSGSGEEALIADVDNDGKVEFLTCNGFRDDKARVEIFEFDEKGELAESPRVIIDGFKDQKCFYCSIVVGDVDNDGKNELIVGWKKDQKINKTTLIGYRIPAEGGQAKPVYTFDEETEDLDLGYFEKMMAIADVDGDGKKELVLSTRGDEMSEHITSKHLGNVFKYNVDSEGKPHRELIAKLNPDRAESSWLAVGDADNDGKPDIVLATGKGNREKSGTGYVLLLTKAQSPLSSAQTQPASAPTQSATAQSQPAWSMTHGRTVIHRDSIWDIEDDVLVTQSATADLQWQYEAPRNRYLAPVNTAKIAVVRGRAYDKLDLDVLRDIVVVNRRLSGSGADNVLRTGVVLALRTTEKNWAKLRVTAFPDRDDIELDWVLWQQPSTPESPIVAATPSSPRTIPGEPSKRWAQRQPTAADMRQIGKRASQGDLAALEELKQIREILYQDIDYNKDKIRASSNLVLMRAAFDEIGQAAGRGEKPAMDALRNASNERGLKSFATPAFGIAAGMGNVEALNILLNYKSNAISISSAVFALQAAAARNEPRTVDFLIDILNDPKHKALSRGASEGLAAAAQAGNQKAREALEQYNKQREK